MGARAICRPMTITDVPVVHALIQRTIGACYRGVYSDGAVSFFERYHQEESIERDLRNGHCLVASCDDRIVGVGALVRGTVKRVFVEPSAQGKGIGRRLMEELHSVARAKGLRELRLDSSLVAVGFYRGLGYVTVSEAIIDLGGGDTLPYLEMMIRL